jgi:signal transduction histidine kinase
MSGRLRLRSLRNKLALLFFGVTATGFGVLYFLVVPQLETNLEERQLDGLERVAPAAAPRFSEVITGDVAEEELNRLVRAAAGVTDARVTLLDARTSLQGPQGEGREYRFYPLSDSSEERAVAIDEALARRAFLAGASRSSVSTGNGVTVAQVAQPVKLRRRPEWVVLYSRNIGDVAETVSFVRSRVLVATGVALLLSLLGGYLVARALARRVRRLEAGARKVARGSYIHPLPERSEDELGQLTRAFNRMQEQLRRVDDARKEFIATASHELRTPIFSLGGFVELLQDEELDEETRREFLETMSEQVARLQKLSVDLLDLSRLDAGSLQLQTEPVDLSELARSVVHEFTPAFAGHETKLECELPPGGPLARCDRERVAQIMRILLDNALRHTPEGTHVTVSAERRNGAAGLTVADTGPGMSHSAQDKVFDRFYTGDATRGAGLGLAIARELAERMEGNLELRSRPGATSFTLELPADADRSPA